MIRLEIKKLQYDINREVAKVSLLSSAKIDESECLTGSEILPPDQRRMMEQVKFTYSPWEKAFEIQRITIEDAAEKQTKTFISLKTHQQFNQLVIYFQKTLLKDEFEKIEQEINREDLICKTCKKKNSKIKFKTTRSLANKIYSNVITLNDPFEEQIKLKNEIFNLNENSLTKNLNKKEKNYWLAETHIGLKWLQLDSNPEPLSS